MSNKIHPNVVMEWANRKRQEARKGIDANAGTKVEMYHQGYLRAIAELEAFLRARRPNANPEAGNAGQAPPTLRRKKHDPTS